MFRPMKPLCAGGLFWVVAVLSIGPAAAQKDSTRAEIEFFENKIRSVLIERCYKCHSAERKQSKGGFRLDSRDHVLKGLAAMLEQGDLADVAVEDMRRWELWNLAGDVFKLYGQKGFDAPLMKRAVIRYGLCCKKTEAADFLKTRRAGESELVQEVEDSLKLEKGR